MKHMNTIAVQTESSESECSKYMSKMNLKSIQQNNNSSEKKQPIAKPGEIPKYVYSQNPSFFN